MPMQHSQMPWARRSVQPLHIAIFSNYLHDRVSDAETRGGIERWTVNLANSLAAAGVSVDVLVRQKRGAELRPTRLDPSVQVIAVGRRKIACAWRLALLQRRRRWSALIAANHPFNFAALWAQPFFKGTTQLIPTIHEHVSQSLARISKPRSFLLGWQMRMSYRRADIIVGVSSGIVEDLKARRVAPRVPIAVINNPVVTQSWLTAAREPIEHPWLAADRSWQTLIAVGRLEAQKDYPTLLRALRLLPESGYRLLVIGDGSQRQELIALADEIGVAERVAWLGWVENPAPWMAASDMLVLSSRSEGLGNVLIEAMALGTKVVSTDCPSGPAEILDGGRLGGLAMVGSPESLAAAIAETGDRGIRPGMLRARSMHYADSEIVGRWLQLEQLQTAA